MGASVQLNFRSDTRLLAKIIMRVTYGYSVADTNDPHVTSSEEALESLGRVAMIGGYFVDSYPFLRHFPTWLPGMGFKAQAREWSKLPFKMANVPFEWTKQQTVSEVAIERLNHKANTC
jgi:hypothetical protein